MNTMRTGNAMLHMPCQVPAMPHMRCQVFSFHGVSKMQLRKRPSTKTRQGADQWRLRVELDKEHLSPVGFTVFCYALLCCVCACVWGCVLPKWDPLVACGESFAHLHFRGGFGALWCLIGAKSEPKAILLAPIGPKCQLRSNCCIVLLYTQHISMYCPILVYSSIVLL